MANIITELKYSNTNTYLVKGMKGYILFDTGWAGTFSLFCRALGELNVKAQDIRYLFISHFHPDHMGIAQEIAKLGITIVVMDVQRAFVHSSDYILQKEGSKAFEPIDDSKIRIIPIQESRSFLHEIGIEGELLHTPGHSDDSVSLYLDEGSVLVGDLNPLYEIELHKGTQIAESWEKLLAHKPQNVYYGHAKPALLTDLSRKKKMPQKKNPSYILLSKR